MSEFGANVFVEKWVRTGDAHGAAAEQPEPLPPPGVVKSRVRQLSVSAAAVETMRSRERVLRSGEATTPALSKDDSPASPLPVVETRVELGPVRFFHIHPFGKARRAVLPRARH
jgi:hypothetical protein